ELAKISQRLILGVIADEREVGAGGVRRIGRLSGDLHTGWQRIDDPGDAGWCRLAAREVNRDHVERVASIREVRVSLGRSACRLCAAIELAKISQWLVLGVIANEREAGIFAICGIRWLSGDLNARRKRINNPSDRSRS